MYAMTKEQADQGAAPQSQMHRVRFRVVSGSPRIAVVDRIGDFPRKAGKTHYTTQDLSVT